MKKNGFTLVELSIALVIVGLLIGGILIGQSMMSSAKVQSVAKALQQYDIAVSNFKLKMKGQLPGDNNIINHGGWYSNNDGYLKNSNNTLNFFGQDDNGSFWSDMSIMGFVYSGKTFKPVTVSPFTTKGRLPNTPSIQLDAAAVAGVVASFCRHYTCSSNNAYVFADWEGAATPGALFSGRPVLKPETAFAIDAKLDDGKPFVGAVQSRLQYDQSDIHSPGCTDYNGTTYSNGTNNATAVYNIANSAITCYLAVALFQNGPSS